MKKDHTPKEPLKDLEIEVNGVDLSLIPLYAIERMAAFLLRKMEEENSDNRP